jgi:hypothetical protein
VDTPRSALEECLASVRAWVLLLLALSILCLRLWLLLRSCHCVTLAIGIDCDSELRVGNMRCRTLALHLSGGSALRYGSGVLPISGSEDAWHSYESDDLRVQSGNVQRK